MTPQYREYLCGKIHQARITDAHLDYIGSITIDSLLLEKADLHPGQKVLVVSNSSGARLETYIIAGKPGSGEVCINGAASYHIRQGEVVIIIGFILSSTPVHPKAILVNQHNQFVDYL